VDGDATETIPRCEWQADDWVPPESARSCWTPLVDMDGVTSTRADDMSHACIDPGYNLEVRLVGTGGWSGGWVRWTCEVAANTDVACPGM
jgi:hypothetical protein